jgi:pilus assembly protein CpaB
MRRILGTLAAAVLGIGGTLLLVGYVRAAENRALAGEELVPVLVVEEAIEKGSPAEEMEGSLRLEQVPAKVRAEGALDDPADLIGLAAAVELLPGEQLVAARLAEPETLLVHQKVEAPPNLLEVTVSLSPERALGGRLEPGALVAVFSSFDPFDAKAVEPGAQVGAEGEEPELPDGTYLGTTEGEEESYRTPTSTYLILHKVLVTNVQVEQLPRQLEEGSPEDAPELAPTGNLLITLAAAPEDAQRIVFTAEHGFIWLAAEQADAAEPETEVEHRGTIYR